MINKYKNESKILPKPAWIRVRINNDGHYRRIAEIIKKASLNTVCEEALCPNKCECWRHSRATIMILGKTCTRACRFCNISPSKTSVVDKDEPRRVAIAVKEIGLEDVVITSVTRDDLPDGGAALWAETIIRVKQAVPDIIIEVLVPDFGGMTDAADLVIKTSPHVFGHNLETVPSLYGSIRQNADYKRSLALLKRASDYGLITKTSIMVGLGERDEEVVEVMNDAKEAGCDIFFIGQYLSPSLRHAAVKRYVPPDTFEKYKSIGLKMGFKVVISAPLVRSSFFSEEQRRYVTEKLKLKE